MTGFPDESQMPRSEDGSEPIRGGSIGFNAVLGRFIKDAASDVKPSFHAVIISAFTIFRNVYQTKSAGGHKPSDKEMEEGFITDVNLFMEYFDAYLSAVWSRLAGDKFCPVIIYFPDYRHVPKDIEREYIGKAAELWDGYKRFLRQYDGHEGEVKKLDHTRCFWMRAGDVTYPHKEVARKFKEVTVHPACLYTSGDPVCLITHVPLDLHISSRLRGVQLLESHTARLRPPSEFRFKLDKDGRVPFQSSVHLLLGDSVIIKSMVSSKIKRTILETASQERWVGRSEDDVRQRLSKISQIPMATMRKYDFG